MSDQIDGLVQDMEGDRSVFVGQRPGDDRVYIKFNNGELETKLCLSFEAAEKLKDLLGAISSRGLMSMSTWVLYSESIPGSPTEVELAS